MIKAVAVSTSITVFNGAQVLVVFAVGDDGFIYQLWGTNWTQLPALDAMIERPPNHFMMPPKSS